MVLKSIGGTILLILVTEGERSYTLALVEVDRKGEEEGVLEKPAAAAVPEKEGILLAADGIGMERNEM